MFEQKHLRPLDSTKPNQLDQAYEHEEILQGVTGGNNIQYTIGLKEGRKEGRWKEGRLTVLVIACIGIAF